MCIKLLNDNLITRHTEIDNFDSEDMLIITITWILGHKTEELALKHKILHLIDAGVISIYLLNRKHEIRDSFKDHYISHPSPS